MNRSAASATAKENDAGLLTQLACGNGSRAENNCNDPCQQGVLDYLLTHDVLLLVLLLAQNLKLDALGSRYFARDAPGIGCDEQNGLPDSMGKMQRQPLAQGLLMPQLPPQVVTPLAPLRNCRAETVPAESAAVTHMASNMF
jgi:hypothetical protein